MQPTESSRAFAALGATSVAVLALLAGACQSTTEASVDATDEVWIELFNGRDLDGWTPKFSGEELGVNYKNTFRVRDGVLAVGYDAYESFDGKFGHLFYEHAYDHYVLELEYRFVGEQVPGGPGWAFRNNGVMVHGQTPETMRVDQDFPVSIEVQLLGAPEGGDGKRTTGNLCTPGTNVVYDGKLDLRHCIGSQSETLRGDQWVKLRIEVHGGEIIRHVINGEEVMHYTAPQLDDRDADAKVLIDRANGEKLLTGGTISLQAESHGTEFRKIRLLPNRSSPAPAAAPSRDYTATIAGTAVEFDMVWVEAGGFWIGRHEVTWNEFLPFCNWDEHEDLPAGVDAISRPSQPLEGNPYDRDWGLGPRPAVGVSWNAAQKYCQWLSAKNGHAYRLPTEAEWELACGAGDSAPLGDRAWYADNSGGMTHEVGQKRPNAHGLYDMLGNLWEYCANPYDPADPKRAVLRGGSWKDVASDVTPTARLRFDNDWTLLDPSVPAGVWWIPDGDHLGFRVLRDG